MQNDPNSQKKGSKRPLNDSSTPPLSPMDEAAVSATAFDLSGNHGSSVRASKVARHDVNKLSYSPQMDKYLNPFQDKWSTRKDFNPKPQVRSAPQGS